MRVPIRKPGKYTFDKPDPHMTQVKYNALKAELDHLKKTRPKAAAEVRRTAEMGDLSENAAYQIAKGRLRSLNQKISDLENHLNLAIIIEPSTGGIVQIGSTVTIRIDGKPLTYTILGSSETDPLRGVISHRSPLGAAIVGKKVGDTVSVRARNGFHVVKIIDIA